MLQTPETVLLLESKLAKEVNLTFTALMVQILIISLDISGLITLFLANENTNFTQCHP